MGGGSLAPNDTWGFDPEHWTVSTPSYSQSYSVRWLNNGLGITQGGASGANILERTHYYVTDTCSRSEDPSTALRTTQVRVPHREHLRPRAGHALVHRGQRLQVHREHRHLLPDRENTVTELHGHAGLPDMAAQTTS